MRNCHCSRRFFISTASVLAGTICIVPLVLGGTVACAREAPIPGASKIVVAQTRETLPTQKDPMSWKDILGKAGPSVSQPIQEPSSRQPSVSAFVLPKLRGRVVDEANLLDQATRVMLTDKLALLEAKTSDRLIVLTLKALQGTSIDDFVAELGQYWQIFQSHGSHEVLVLVALNERQVHIHVGYRLQSTLTDAIAKSIIDKTLVPRIGVNDFTGGISSTVDDIIHVLMPNSPESVGPSRGPSFDCNSAKNANEKLICQSTELSDLDTKMVALFHNVLNLLNSADQQELRKSQSNWLKERLDCGDDFICTKQAYAQRIQRLSSILAKLSPEELPLEYQGVWINPAQWNNECNKSDWNNRSPRHIRITPLRVELWNSVCRIAVVKTKDQAVYNPYGYIDIGLSCEGKGISWQEDENWHIKNIDGRRYLIMTIYKISPGRSSGSTDKPDLSPHTDIFAECDVRY